MFLKIKNTKIYEWIKKHKNITMLISLFTFIITTIISTFFTEITTKVSDKVLNKVNNVEYVDEPIITPLRYDTDFSSIEDIRNFSNSYNNEILFEGCTLNTYVRNNKNSSLFISETAVVIDDIKELNEISVYAIGSYSVINNVFSIYVINNDIYDLNNGYVELTYEFTKSDSNIVDQELDDEMSSQFFQSIKNNDNKIMNIKNLKGGEIRKINDLEVFSSFFENNSSISIYYKIINGANNDILQDGNLGTIYKMNNEIQYSPSEVGSPDNTINRLVEVNTKKIKIGEKINVPSNILINGSDTVGILYNIFPTSSCSLTFHASIKCAGENKYINSNIKQQKIYVPLYKTDYWTWNSVRNFVEKYNIENYYYQSNPTIQKEIEYIYSDYYNQN